MNVQKKYGSVTFCTPPSGDLAHNPGMCPGNRTGNLLVFRPVLNPLSHTGQGYTVVSDKGTHFTAEEM